MKFFNLLFFIFGTTAFLISTPAGAIAFNMAPLEFSNRAGCADLSNKPARSAFLQIDAFNAGKAGFSQGILAQRNQSTADPAVWAQKGAKDFRIWSSHLAYEIMNALKNGKLPLLQADGTSPAMYNKAVEKCLSKKQLLSCPAMNDLLAEFWSRSKMQKPNWQELGLGSNDFFPANLSTNATIGCHIVRKFSSFHSPLKTQTLENGTITNIAIDSYKPEDSLDSCFSTADGKDPRFTTVQLDMANLAKDSDWDSIGFRFWHSFKLFYSWGWRYAPEYTQEFGQLKQSFSSIAFEDSVMLLPNGCRSIEVPKCDSTGLSSDILRAAKFLGATHPSVGELPQRPIDTLFSGKADSVNNDNLGLFKAENASAWSRDFKEKLSGLRFEMQRKLNTGLAKLRIITSLVNSNQLSQDINAILEDGNYDKTETYLACMEFTLAKNDLFNDIDAEIQTLNNTQELQSVLLADSGKDLRGFIDYYKSLTGTMGLFCKALEMKGRATAGNNNPDTFKALNEWAFGLLQPLAKNSYTGLCVQTPNNPVCPQNQDRKYLVTRPRQSKGQADEFTICKTSLECARTVLSSLVSIISVRRYAHAFLPLDEIIKSPNLFNNYATPTACHLYDPWSKQRNAWKLFVADMGSALLQGATCGTIQTRVLELPTDNVIGYKEIMDQEEMSYKAETNHEPIKYVAGVDYSFLPGLSCGAAVANTIITGPQTVVQGYYGQLQVRACDGTSDVEYTIDRNAKLDPNFSSFNRVVKNDKNVVQQCFRCSFGLSAIAKYACAVPLVGQVAAAGIGLFQGVLRLISNLTDADNINSVSQVNVDQISVSFAATDAKETYCHNKLKRGVTCDTKKAKGSR
jgi:hypothetical protein